MEVRRPAPAYIDEPGCKTAAALEGGRPGAAAGKCRDMGLERRLVSHGGHGKIFDHAHRWGRMACAPLTKPSHGLIGPSPTSSEHRLWVGGEFFTVAGRNSEVGMLFTENGRGASGCDRTWRTLWRNVPFWARSHSQRRSMHVAP